MSLPAIFMVSNTDVDTYEILEENKTDVRSLNLSAPRSGFYLQSETNQNGNLTKSKPTACKITSDSRGISNNASYCKPDQDVYDEAKFDELYDNTVNLGDEVIYKAGE